MRLLVCRLAILAAIIAGGQACKTTNTQSEAKLAGDDVGAPKEASTVDMILGRNELENVRNHLATILHVDPNDAVYQVQFRLFKCAASSLLAAFTGGDTIPPELAVSILDSALYMTDLTLTTTDLLKMENAPNVPTSLFETMRISINMAWMGWQAISLGGLADYEINLANTLIKEMSLPAAKVTTVAKAFEIIKTRWPNLDFTRRMAAAQADQQFSTASKVLVFGPVILRCVAAIGDGGIMLVKETASAYQAYKDMVASKESLRKQCPQYDDFTKCQQICGGQGYESAFVKDRAKACQGDSARYDEMRGAIIGAYADRCLQTYCVDAKTHRMPPVTKESQCVMSQTYIQKRFVDPVTQKERTLDQFQADCCGMDLNPTSCAVGFLARGGAH